MVLSPIAKEGDKVTQIRWGNILNTLGNNASLVFQEEALKYNVVHMSVQRIAKKKRKKKRLFFRFNMIITIRGQNVPVFLEKGPFCGLPAMLEGPFRFSLSCCMDGCLYVAHQSKR